MNDFVQVIFLPSHGLREAPRCTDTSAARCQLDGHGVENKYELEPFVVSAVECAYNPPSSF